MVFNKRDLERAFSPKTKHKRPLSRNGPPNVVSSSSTIPRSNIKVYVRVRPFSEQEQASKLRNTIQVIDDKMLVFDPKEESEGFFFHGVQQKGRDIAKKTNKEMQFIFDRVFGSESNNLDVYNSTTKGIISTLLEGYNCSVFVYGATGAGKTHTMLGNKENPGITCLTMNELFQQIEELNSTKTIEIGITYLEVYNENVHDLLNPCGPMHLRDDSNGGVMVAGMKVEKITSAERLFQLLQRGNMNRTQHPTDANAESSRSHAVFQVYLRIQTKASGELKYCKLTMIDLAGSERGSATGCIGPRFKEGSNINKSLLALGNCINNLADGLRHIPYRDSKLTRILKDSLGGNCQTVMIANISPSILSYEDTYNTLKYATRAKSIKTQLTKNVMSVNLRVEHYVRMCDEFKKEVASLKEQIDELNRKLVAEPPQQADPVYVEKLNHLYREKKQIHTEWLNLEAQLKLLQWRIRCKSFRNKMLKSQRAHHSTDYDQEHERDEKSLIQLEARADSIMEKMSEKWCAKEKHTEEYNKFSEEMENAKVTKLLQPEAKLRDVQCKLAEVEIQNSHYQKIINMQEKHLEDLNSAVDFLTKLSANYHLLLRGRDMVTDSMASEYQEGVKKVKGTKAVTWLDKEWTDMDDDEGVALNPFSVRPFKNLSLANLQSCSLPIVVVEPRVRPDGAPSTEVVIRREGVPTTQVSGPMNDDLNGTFVLESPQSEHPNTGINKTSIMQLKKPKLVSVPMRKFTPARKAVNKENTAQKIKAFVKQSIVTPGRPKTALTSRPTNIAEVKTPEPKVMSAFKMIRESDRKRRLNHSYSIPIKLKRLGVTFNSETPRKIPRV